MCVSDFNMSRDGRARMKMSTMEMSRMEGDGYVHIIL